MVIQKNAAPPLRMMQRDDVMIGYRDQKLTR